MLLYWAAVFFVIAIVAGLFGFSGVEHGAVDISKTLFFVFVVLFLLALISGVFFVGGPVVA
jgi:uncharacterized membrane protein YtjA (UPF0391 family)